MRPDHGDALVQRGQVHEQLGNAELARPDYEEAALLGINSRWLQRSLRRVKGMVGLYSPNDA